MKSNLLSLALITIIGLSSNIQGNFCLYNPKVWLGFTLGATIGQGCVEATRYGYQQYFVPKQEISTPTFFQQSFNYASNNQLASISALTMIASTAYVMYSAYKTAKKLDELDEIISGVKNIMTKEPEKNPSQS